jgi:dTDP-4-amino-4,6-dideoxygalactose transaminase
MAIPLVDLKAQYHTIKADIDAAVGRVLENSSFILGPEVESFEQSFAAYHGTRYAVGVDSGTAALHLALMAYAIGPGDEVITTTMTFIATAAAVSHAGATPVFVDIDPRTYNIDPARIEAAITPRTKAILPVHLYGQPCEMDAILQVANKHGLRVIEDACQAIGANYKGRRAGSLGDAGCFSFYPAKNLGAAGDGGMLITNDDALADCVRKLRDHGRISKYSHGMIGFTYRLDGLQAAILGVKLPHVDAWNEARRQHAARYSALLREIPGLTVPYEGQGCRSIYHVYALRASRRDALLDHLRSKGIGASIHYPLPVHQQPAYAFMNLPTGSYPRAEALSQEEISLPIYPEMTNGQIDEVVAAIRGFVA